MRFDPNDAELLCDTEAAPFKVINVLEYDKDGKDAVKLTLFFKDKNGKHGNVLAYITNAWLMKQFCECVGISPEKFSQGNITSNDLYDKRGRATIALQIDPEGRWQDKNVVKRFIKCDPSQVETQNTKPAKAEAVTADPSFDDGIPF